jgi:uncharacterized protein (DUF2235 family)
MGKNILIFADGTGNEGGLIPDESRTNVYKLFRATRTGPDSTIDPSKQIAFYVPGVGTPSGGHSNWLKRKWEGFQGAIGIGLTRRIVDCYVAIISVWEPADRIYLFGFSRGDYAVRCVARILELLGIPTQEADGKPLSFEPTALRSLAKSGIKILYRMGLPIKNEASRDREVGFFKTGHLCKTGIEIGAIPYFIGVWDTVAALGWNHFLISKALRKMPFLSTHYDVHFPEAIPYARHAMAIDEYRRDFVRVPWGGSGTVSYDDLDGVQRFNQVWFAGNHSDIGGSYPENESRLSDITLKWMSDFVSKELPENARVLINVDDPLRCFPSSDGMMHDELMVGMGRSNVHVWARGDRKVDPEGELHFTVKERLKMERVRNFVGFGPYRPEALKDHPQARAITNPHPDAKPTHQSPGDCDAPCAVRAR